MLWNRLLQLAEEQPAGTTLAAFASQLGERARLQFEPTMPTVSVLTVHTAKGLEWEIVYLAGCVEGLMPISYAQTPAEIEEERRLFYVAVTRAKRRLELFVPRHSSGRERRQEISRFIGELGPRVRTSLYVQDQQRHLPEEPQGAGPSAASA
nr:3'-5' exonuclease [Pseudoclavibacter alba]